MAKQYIQAPASVVMIRPHRFHPNPETATDNAFQRSNDDHSAEITAQEAFTEVTDAARKLEAAGVRVHIFEDRGEKETPDSVFPNNWFSTHSGGHIALYPMYSPSRRRERRYDIIDMLKAEYRVQDIIDYSSLEYDDLFLEGTGAMVLDHIARIAYTAQSNRANAIALERFCTHFNFEPMAFATADKNGNPIYHTNVMMCIATDFAMVGFDIIQDPERRREIYARLEETGRDVISLSHQQIEEFAGNAIELSTPEGRILAISTRAAASLDEAQKKIIEHTARIVELHVPTVELAGGSVRCMLAGIHLSRRYP
ncbi:MAG: arginine deiminase-related protein [Desulfocapsaceae bacterium]|nr:arginine deiminase-related protein [Desulfocapsaceae bacterium]